MTSVTLSATPSGNGYQATITYASGVTSSSAETFPTVADAITAAGLKMLRKHDRLDLLGRLEIAREL